MVNTILFDLDGTLLPFFQKDFIEAYFGGICQSMAPFGYASEDVVKALWNGCKAMIKNDGSVQNIDRFWDGFAEVLGEEVRDLEAPLDAFYRTTYDDVRRVLREATPAKKIIDILKQKGYTLVLATNPLFPRIAQQKRMGWAGLESDDFALVTDYENSRFCKPNPRYYEEILGKISKTPAECLMVGNSVSEDMIAKDLGMAVYLVTGYVENPKGLPTDGYPQGALADFAAYVQTLPSLTEE